MNYSKGLILELTAGYSYKWLVDIDGISRGLVEYLFRKEHGKDVEEVNVIDPEGVRKHSHVVQLAHTVAKGNKLSDLCKKHSAITRLDGFGKPFEQWTITVITGEGSMYHIECDNKLDVVDELIDLQNAGQDMTYVNVFKPKSNMSVADILNCKE